MGWARGLKASIVGGVMIASTNSAFALSISTGCVAHNIVQTNGVVVGFPLVNRNFSSTGVFEAGEVITFSASDGPTQVVNITSFTITETTTSTTILNATAGTTVTFTIPANGTFFFDVRISATNPGPNAGVINYTRSCVAGVVVSPPPPPPPPPPPGPGGPTTPTTLSTAQQIANINKSNAQILYGIGAGNGFGIGGQIATNLLGGTDEVGTLPSRYELAESGELIRLEAQRDDLKKLVESGQLAQDLLLNIAHNAVIYGSTETERLLLKEAFDAPEAYDSARTSRYISTVNKIHEDQRKRNVLINPGDSFVLNRQIYTYTILLLSDWSAEEALGQVIHETNGKVLEEVLIPPDQRLKFDRLGTAAEALVGNQIELENVELKIKNLEAKIGDEPPSGPGVHSIRDEVRGVVVLAGLPSDKKTDFAARNPGAFRLTRLGDQSGSFVASLGQMRVFPAAGKGVARPLDYDVWVRGRASFLDDGSSVGRKGYSGNISMGAAKKLADGFVLAAEIIGRSGAVDIDKIQSDTDFKGIGAALTGAFSLTDKVNFALTGFYERGWFDTSLAGATGSFNSDRFGMSASLSGTYQAGEFVLQPGLAVAYSSAKLSSYTDSTAVFVPGQTTKNGNFNSSMTISRTLAGGEKLVSWQPYATGRAYYNFTQEKNLAISPTLVVNDSRFNGEIGSGAQFNFPGGIKASVGATYFGLFGNGVNTINFGVNLTVPLN